MCLPFISSPNSELKVTVTGTKTLVSRKYEQQYTIDAHHRFVVLSNFIDGLGCDFASGNRRFMLMQPTNLIKRIPCYNDFQAKYVDRFIKTDKPPTFKNALFKHLTTLPVQYRTTADWEGKLKEFMADSTMHRKSEALPVSLRWLYEFTTPEVGPCTVPLPPMLKVDEARGVYRCDKLTQGTNIMEGEEPTPFFYLEVSRAALYGECLKQLGTSMPADLSQTKFTQEVSKALQASVGWDSNLAPGDDPEVGARLTVGASVAKSIERKQHGVRIWCFKTLAVHRFLAAKYPTLVEAENAETKSRLVRLGSDMQAWIGLDE